MPERDDRSPSQASVSRREGLVQRLLEHLRADLDLGYDFVSFESRPFTPAPSRQATRLALVTTGGLHLREDSPFRAAEERWGDTSYRAIPHGTRAEAMQLDAIYVDQRYTAQDPEVALPQATLAAMVEDGEVGAAAATHYSFCGGIVRPLPGLEESVETLAPALAADGVNAIVLLPTCSLCVQTICVLSRLLEERGFATVTASLIPELSRMVGAPRTLEVPFPFGAPCGDPGHRELQRGVLSELLELLWTAKEFGEVRESEGRWRR